MGAPNVDESCPMCTVHFLYVIKTSTHIGRVVVSLMDDCGNHKPKGDSYSFNVGGSLNPSIVFFRKTFVGGFTIRYRSGTVQRTPEHKQRSAARNVQWSFFFFIFLVF